MSTPERGHPSRRSAFLLAGLLLIAGLVIGVYALMPAPRDLPSAVPTPPSPGASFDGASALADLRTIYELGPRHHGSPGHAACRRLIEERLAAAGARVEVETFQGRGGSGLEGSFTN